MNQFQYSYTCKVMWFARRLRCSVRFLYSGCKRGNIYMHVHVMMFACGVEDWFMYMSGLLESPQHFIAPRVVCRDPMYTNDRSNRQTNRHSTFTIKRGKVTVSEGRYQSIRHHTQNQRNQNSRNIGQSNFSSMVGTHGDTPPLSLHPNVWMKSRGLRPGRSIISESTQSVRSRDNSLTADIMGESTESISTKTPRNSKQNRSLLKRNGNTERERASPHNKPGENSTKREEEG